jgi:alkylation response protein AidB-like acyl-CoA dehydrogenase
VDWSHEQARDRRTQEASDVADTAERTTTDAVTEVTEWLEESWDPDLTVAEWWERLGTSGWAAPTWPVESFGAGLSRNEGVAVQRAIQDFGALGAPGGLGLLLAGPTIATHGDEEQRARYLRDIVTGQKAWCQLFSEPGAGSDLAGLNCKAIRDGDEWVVTGQKVWTSGGHIADLGMLIARTDPDVPKHQGISYFAIDMHQPGSTSGPCASSRAGPCSTRCSSPTPGCPDDAVIGGSTTGGP